MTEARPMPLPASEAYRLWAPTYEVENVVTALDEVATHQLTPPLSGKALLDAGCGTGRRVPQARVDGPRLAVGVDLVREMLIEGRKGARRRPVMAADMMALPFADRTFDVIWCRLVVGHLRELVSAYSEFMRVLTPGGCAIVTDFHPQAARAGHTRSFKDPTGTTRAVEHRVYDLGDHTRAAARAGLSLDTSVDLRIGPMVQRFYEAAGLLHRYAEQCGLPLVIALRFIR